MANKQHLEMVGESRKVFVPWQKATETKQLDLTDADLRELAGARIDQLEMPADFSGSNISGLLISGCDLSGDKFVRTIARNTTFKNCSLKKTDITGADFYEAAFVDCEFSGIRGAPDAKNLDTARVKPSTWRDQSHFADCKRQWPDIFFSWEMIRKVGNLRFFTVSYTLLAFFLLLSQGIRLYNDQITLIRGWAQKAVDSADFPSHLLANEILEHSSLLHFSTNTLVLFVSTLVLAIASTIYTFLCPDEIKEFTRSQWLHALRKDLLNYWALAWKMRKWRVACALLYLIGGIPFVTVIGIKIFNALVYTARLGLS